MPGRDTGISTYILRDRLPLVFTEGAQSECRFRLTVSESLAALDELALWGGGGGAVEPPLRVLALAQVVVASRVEVGIGSLRCASEARAESGVSFWPVAEVPPETPCLLLV